MFANPAISAHLARITTKTFSILPLTSDGAWGGSQWVGGTEHGTALGEEEKFGGLKGGGCGWH